MLLPVFRKWSERNVKLIRKVNLIIATLFWLLVAASSYTAQTALDGEWQGALVREGSEAKVIVNFKKIANGFDGTMTMPTVGMFRQPLSKITLSSPQVHFEQDNLAAIFD